MTCQQGLRLAEQTGDRRSDEWFVRLLLASSPPQQLLRELPHRLKDNGLGAGMLAYRLGDLDTAVACLTPSLADYEKSAAAGSPYGRYLRIVARCYLAMLDYQRGDRSRAVGALAVAQEQFRQNQVPVTPGWKYRETNWYVTRIALREAEAVIEARPAASAPTSRPN